MSGFLSVKVRFWRDRRYGWGVEWESGVGMEIETSVGGAGGKCISGAGVWTGTGAEVVRFQREYGDGGCLSVSA